MVYLVLLALWLVPTAASVVISIRKKMPWLALGLGAWALVAPFIAFAITGSSLEPTAEVSNRLLNEAAAFIMAGLLAPLIGLVVAMAVKRTQ